MATTNHLGITTVSAAQSQKEVTINNAIKQIDALLNSGVEDMTHTAPPMSPVEGTNYIIAATATGAWAGLEDYIALYYDSGWHYIEPNQGAMIWNNDDSSMYVYDNGAWGIFAGGAVGFANVPLFGVNATADSTNKLAVKSESMLLMHPDDSGDLFVKAVKETAGDTCSWLFQTNFSTRAEVGLSGDDNFHFKVSPDGSTFHDSVILDRNNGNFKIQKKFLFQPPSELTIASGAVTVTANHHKIDTEADGATDDLDTINGGEEGMLLILQPQDDARTVVIRHIGGGTGNVRTKTGSSVSLDNYGDTFMAIYDGSNWLEV